MKNLRSFQALRARPAAPRCRNGVSSLLRLSQPDAARLPQAQTVSDWAARAASLLAGPEFTVGPLAARR
jgi:hypothetical protein